MVDIEAVWRAALLHDIGKFWERTGEQLPPERAQDKNDAAYSHEPFSAWFVDEYLAGWPGDLYATRQCVLKHHCPSTYDEQLVSLADRLSATERTDAEKDRRNQEGARGRSDTALRAVLTRVKPNGREGGTPLYHDLSPLRLPPESDVLMPKPRVSVSKERYADLWREFTREFRTIPPGDVGSTLAVLRKYTWAIPSDTQRTTIPDVSLFDHLKTTAAIAACLAHEDYGEEETSALSRALTRRYKREALSPREKALIERPFCALMKGDISGTQDFLYLMTSSGAARGLRGRSFFLQLLTETLADYALRRFDLQSTNLLFVGGGHFYLLVPHRLARERIDALRESIAKKLWQAYRGDVSFSLDFASIAPGDLQERQDNEPTEETSTFAEKWGEVSQRVNERKLRKWRDLGAQGMVEELFGVHQRGTTAEAMCQVCHGEWRAGRDRMDDDIRKCRRCEEFEELGRKLRDPKSLVRFDVPEGELDGDDPWYRVLGAFGTSVWLLSDADDADNVPEAPDGATAAHVYRLDSTDFLNGAASVFKWDGLQTSFDFRLLANATPTHDDGQIADFHQLASASDGVGWLGVLRMDVDSLGEVFRSRLGRRNDVADEHPQRLAAALLRGVGSSSVPRMERATHEQPTVPDLCRRGRSVPRRSVERVA